ncbi:MAG: ATP-dependent RecD-like DNA helicase [Anaerolineae bacterium]|nr:ATP-dependent RecD-like DNA helicase [Anaerolineae bacterium]
MTVGSTPVGAEYPLQTLEGTVERLTFQSEETGYTVARVVPKGKSHLVTVVGPLAGVNPGESVRLQGRWTNHPQYGRQFEARTYSVELPATIEGLRKYLGSGLIKGIGPVTAARVVNAFGLEAMDVIEESPSRLLEVPGIGEKRSGMIVRAWEEQKQIKDLMVFLQSHGVSTGLAVKIYRHYGDQAVAVVREDPYRLARDVYGIGFKTADKIARNLGLAPDAPARVQAGLLYALSTLCDEGHCYATQEQLLQQASELLEVPADACGAQLEALLRQNDLVAEDDAVYLPPFLHAETGIASRIHRLQTTPQDRLGAFATVDWDRAFSWLDRLSAIALTPQQKAAIRMALTERVSILTGGPGTGKSTIVAGIVQLLRAKERSVLLAAPTGRAAKRLTETTGVGAKTIHRLLEFQPAAGYRFLRDRDNPLDADILIVDEASMIDVLLMNHLVAAVPPGGHLLLVGDVDQLPSVGPGNVLRDLIASRRVPTTRLDTIFRQSPDSFIIVNAHRINQGEIPLFERHSRDFFLFPERDARRAAERVIELVTRRIPARFGFDPMDDIQVLAPMHRGAAGVGELNERLQAALNPPSPSRAERRHGHRVFRVGDRVMQIRNNYDRQVFNGDLGRVAGIDLEEGLIVVSFDGRPVAYDFVQLDELAHAYALSIHKSQGCEFPVVVVPLLTQHYVMLQRNLLYTAVTRAREMVVLVGDRRAIAMAVRNNRVAQRNTRLADRLRALETR